jgi:hypothetical protein
VLSQGIALGLAFTLGILSVNFNDRSMERLLNLIIITNIRLQSANYSYTYIPNHDTFLETSPLSIRSGTLYCLFLSQSRRLQITVSKSPLRITLPPPPGGTISQNSIGAKEVYLDTPL